VNAAGDAVWRSGCVNKGVTEGRWASGVRNAGPKYAANFAPFQAAMAGINLTKRGTRGSPANLTRVSQIASALHNLKVSGHVTG